MSLNEPTTALNFKLLCYNVNDLNKLQCDE